MPPETACRQAGFEQAPGSGQLRFGRAFGDAQQLADFLVRIVFHGLEAEHGAVARRAQPVGWRRPTG